jgi:hypothetical protein
MQRFCHRCHEYWDSVSSVVAPKVCAKCKSPNWQIEKAIKPLKVTKFPGRPYSYPALVALEVGEETFLPWLSKEGRMGDSRPINAVRRLRKQTGRKYWVTPGYEGLFIRRTA